MDNIFKKVFKNKVIRNLIFKKVNEINQELGLTGKQYKQTKIKWIVQSNNFQLMIYKFKKEVNTQQQFTDEEFYHFLSNNYDLELLKQVIEIFEEKFTQYSTDKIIQQVSYLKPTKLYGQMVIVEIVNYLMNRFPGLKLKQFTIDAAASVGNVELLKFYFNHSGNYVSISKNSNCGVLTASIRSNDYNFFCELLDKNDSLLNYCSSEAVLRAAVDNHDDIRFLKHCYDSIDFSSLETSTRSKLIKFLITIVCELGTLEAIKFLVESDYQLYQPLCQTNFIAYTITGRNNLEILKYFIEEMKIDESDVLKDVCFYGNLESVKYLFARCPNLLETVSEATIDFAIISNNKELFYWIIENTNKCCGNKGFIKLANDLPSSKDQLYCIFEKYSSKIDKQIILNLLNISEYIAKDYEMYNYLTSFLTDSNLSIPSFQSLNK